MRTMKMMGLAVTLAIVLPGMTQAEGHRYFPLEPGMVWSYGDGQVRAEVTGVSEDPDSLAVYHVRGSIAGAFRVDGDRVLEVTRLGERLLFDLSAEPGDVWTIDGSLEDGDDILSGAEVRLVDRAAVVTTPLGTFREVLHYGLVPRDGLADAGITDIWLAPGVGLVQWTEVWFGGVRTRELTGFRGGLVPMPPEVLRYPNSVRRAEGDRLYGLGLDRETYYQGQRIRMRYDVALDDDAAAADSTLYSFDTTQQIEFTITDSLGDVLWRWSDGRGFGEALTWFTLQPGERKAFDGEVLVTQPGSPIASRDQAALPPGHYTMQGYLPTSDLREVGVPSGETVVSSAFTVVGEAATDVELRGVVVEVAGGEIVPVPGAALTASYIPLVRLDGSTGSAGTGPVVETTTGSDGTYSISGLIPGHYLVEASLDGYQTESVQVRLGRGVTPLRLALSRTDPEGFENAHAWDHGRFIGELALERVRYSPEDTVRVRYRLIYTGEDPATLTFPSGQRYDLQLDGSRGRVWTWSENKDFIQVVTTQTMAPGDTLEVREAFALADARATTSGSYQLRAITTATAPAESEDDSTSTVRIAPGRYEETAAVVKFVVEGETRPPEPDGVSASLEIASAGDTPADSLGFEYRLVNAGTDSVTLVYPSGQEYDIVLENSDGRWVWVWSSTRLFPATVWERTLAPGDTVVTHEFLIPEQVGASAGGPYVLRMYQALGKDGSVTREMTEARTTFRVPGTGSQARELVVDFDGDRRVGFSDFLMFAQAFGRRVLQSDPDRKFDLDNDGTVGFEDFLTFAARFGERR